MLEIGTEIEINCQMGLCFLEAGCSTSSSSSDESGDSSSSASEESSESEGDAV